MLKKLMLLSVTMLFISHSLLALDVGLGSIKPEITAALRVALAHADGLTKALVKLQMESAVPRRGVSVGVQEAMLHEWAVFAAHLTSEIYVVVEEQLEGTKTAELECKLGTYRARWERENRS